MSDILVSNLSCVPAKYKEEIIKEVKLAEGKGLYISVLLNDDDSGYFIDTLSKEEHDKYEGRTILERFTKASSFLNS